MAKRRGASRRKLEEEQSRPRKTKWASSWFDEAGAVLCLAVALFVLASFVSHVAALSSVLTFEAAPAPSARHNVMGPMGHFVATLLVGSMGWCSLVPVFCLGWLSIYLWRLDSTDEGEGRRLGWSSVVGFLGVLLTSCVLAAVLWGTRGGGSLGMSLARPLINLFDRVGAALIGGAAFLLALAVITRLSVLEIVKNISLVLGFILRLAVQIPLVATHLILIALKGGWRLLIAAVVWFGFLPRREGAEREAKTPPARLRKNSLSADGGGLTYGGKDAQSEAEKDGDAAAGAKDGEKYTHVVVSRRLPPRHGKKREYVRDPLPLVGGAKSSAEDEEAKTYEPPALSLLTPGEVSAAVEDDTELREKSRLIENKLGDFGVLGRVTQVHPGPVITLFEFEPAAGVKVGRVASLADDLAMSLRASSIRIIAPIPKRGTVGIEIPNRHRDIVRLRDVLESDVFINSESILSACIGKDTYGEPMVVDIAVMPHLLMAGATGTGKSVCINAILLSFLYRASPEELGLILIDPKILELSVYEGIPHLRVPVVTNPRQAKAVLQWAVAEMHRRYRLIQRYGVRNIDGYNRIVSGEDENNGKGRKRKLDDEVVMLHEESVIEEGAAEGPETGMAGEDDLFKQELKPLPKIVIVIDEVADLMLSVGHDIEELITRLAQKARAAGIHLIVATQRPSVDVVTGLIKANFPARLSFRVSSRVDSRTILDSMGAEKLLGRGDMLVMLPGGESLKRMHGAFVSDHEVVRVVAAVKAQAQPHYDEHIMQVCERALEEEEAERENRDDGLDGGDYDAVYDKAVELVVQRGQASTSMLQRAFRIGYNRAARIIDMMEREGIIGPMDGAKPREILVPRSESE